MRKRETTQAISKLCMCVIFIQWKCTYVQMYICGHAGLPVKQCFLYIIMQGVLCPRVNCPNATIPEGECCAVCPKEPPECAVG